MAPQGRALKAAGIFAALERLNLSHHKRSRGGYQSNCPVCGKNEFTFEDDGSFGCAVGCSHNTLLAALTTTMPAQILPATDGPPVLKAALAYARRGWYVLPVQNKKPLTAHGVYDASTDEDVIRGWWRRWPSAGVAIACGPSGLVVIDCDVKNGVDGITNWLAFSKSNGIDPLGTMSATTPSGGKHFVYKAPPGVELARKIAFLPGVDILAGPASYFVAPPSTREGRDYSWLN